MMMKSANFVNHNFIPHDDVLLKNDGVCVLDNFVGTYSTHIKKLTQITLLIYVMKLEEKSDSTNQGKYPN